MNNILLLSKGCYMADTADVFDAGDLIIGKATYSEETLSSEMHCHENSHISFVLQGGNLEKRRGKRTERIPGNIEFYYAGEAHQTIPKIYPSKNVILEIDNSFHKKTGITESDISSAVTRNTDGKFLILKMYKELLTSDELSSISIDMLFLDFITRSENRFSERERPAWVKVIYELLHENWNEKLSLQQLATAADVHPITISKNFRKYFSCTFGEYMRKLKVEKSLAYLNERSSSLTEVAYRCNFADQSHFIRTFKEHTGFLPKEFRKL